MADVVFVGWGSAYKTWHVTRVRGAQTKDSFIFSSLFKYLRFIEL